MSRPLHPSQNRSPLSLSFFLSLFPLAPLPPLSLPLISSTPLSLPTRCTKWGHPLPSSAHDTRKTQVQRGGERGLQDEAGGARAAADGFLHRCCLEQHLHDHGLFLLFSVFFFFSLFIALQAGDKSPKSRQVHPPGVHHSLCIVYYETAVDTQDSRFLFILIHKRERKTLASCLSPWKDSQLLLPSLPFPAYRGISLITNDPPVGPFSGPMPRTLRWSQGRKLFLRSEEPLYP